MALSTIDRRPPPFFRQGVPALSKLVLCAALAVFLMAADTRLSLTGPIRSAIATALLPVQQLLIAPVRAVEQVGQYMGGLKAALAGADAAREQLVKQSVVVARAEQWRLENARLRALLALRPALQIRALAAGVLYEAADPYSRKLFLDRGATHGVRHGAPVVNDQGVLGQITEVYPLSSVVTLLIDRDAAIPVVNARTQQRAAAFGGAVGGRAMELRFITANADFQVGDVLTTSGVDDVYPSRLLVGRVARVERRADAGFARVLVAPAAGIEGVRHVLVLEPTGLQLPARPDPSSRLPAPRSLNPAAAASGPAAVPGALLPLLAAGALVAPPAAASAASAAGEGAASAAATAAPRPAGARR